MAFLPPLIFFLVALLLQFLLLQTRFLHIFWAFLKFFFALTQGGAWTYCREERFGTPNKFKQLQTIDHNSEKHQKTTGKPCPVLKFNAKVQTLVSYKQKTPNNSREVKETSEISLNRHLAKNGNVLFGFSLMAACSESSETLLHAASASLSQHVSEQKFRSLFGGPSLAIERCWFEILSKMEPLPLHWGMESLLMTLHFLKNQYTNLNSIATFWHVDSRTLLKNVEITLTLLDYTLPDV